MENIKLRTFHWTNEKDLTSGNIWNKSGLIVKLTCKIDTEITTLCDYCDTEKRVLERNSIIYTLPVKKGQELHLEFEYTKDWYDFMYGDFISDFEEYLWDWVMVVPRYWVFKNDMISMNELRKYFEIIEV